jgi:hypothetical protein
MIEHKADFSELEWTSPMPGVRHKCVNQGDWRLRLVEYSREMPPHWCEMGHFGYVIEGQVDIEYADGRVTYGPGDGIIIADGFKHRHRAHPLTERVQLFFVEGPEQLHQA